MIDPTNITKYNRNQGELEEFLLFSIMVAGKSAKTTTQKLNQFLNTQQKFGLNNFTPLSYVDYLVNSGLLDAVMKNCKLGQYNRLSKAFKGIVKFQNRLHEVSVQDLESISGIGAKTARFFILHSKENARLAVLDTHILKWLKLHGENAPKATPTGKKYALLEGAFLNYAEKYDLHPATLDLHIWKQYSQK
jgi:thermostable 8-oxoguanine DNA glycosylase